jgi:site-specific recombinase XerD
MGEFLVQEAIWRKNPLRWIRGPKIDVRARLPKRIGREHLRKIWDAAYERRHIYTRYQSVCILAILYGTGLRRGELERLNVGDWDRDQGILKIDGRKTGRPRQVPLGGGVWRCIEAYLPHRHNILEKTGRLEEQALLVNRSGERLKGEYIGRLVHRLAKSADVPLVNLHQFRHSCASDLLEEGVTLPEVQRILGHAAIESTMRYVDITDPERVAAMQKHPINEFLVEREEEVRRQAS